MAHSREKTIELMQSALLAIDELDASTRREIFESEGWIEILQTPIPELRERLNDYFEWCNGRKVENAGELLEEIAYLLFKSLKGHQNIRSYQSFAAQHDLVVDGSSPAWHMLMNYLHLPQNGRTIIVECKNQEKEISDQQFSRLCGILRGKFDETAHLGIFISHTTASGFPKNNAKKRSLSNARATQVIFHADTKKFVVVIDHKNLEMIAKGVSFPKILEAKIREVEAAYGGEISFTDEWEETKLPAHLEKYGFQ